jgi:hypothetical protein
VACKEGEIYLHVKCRYGGLRGSSPIKVNIFSYQMPINMQSEDTAIISSG